MGAQKIHLQTDLKEKKTNADELCHTFAHFTSFVWKKFLYLKKKVYIHCIQTWQYVLVLFISELCYEKMYYITNTHTFVMNTEKNILVIKKNNRLSASVWFLRFSYSEPTISWLPGEPLVDELPRQIKLRVQYYLSTYT